jgi:hypothetical protein
MGHLQLILKLSWISILETEGQVNELLLQNNENTVLTALTHSNGTPENAKTA